MREIFVSDNGNNIDFESLRTAPRAEVSATALMHYRRSQIPVVLTDLSYGGVGLAYFTDRARRFSNGQLLLEVPKFRTIPLKLCWKSPEFIGASFAMSEDDALDVMMEIDAMMVENQLEQIGQKLC